MSLSRPPACIRLRGVRQNNLKNFDLDIPLKQLTVITGLSGSGKSSLAFDTLFAEGQRRYIETFSPYARQFFDRMDKPKVDRIEGIPPAIAVEQRNAVRSTRSTVGTMTEICEYMKVVWRHLSTLYCSGCGARVRRETPSDVWAMLTHAGNERHPSAPTSSEVWITFDLPLSDKLPLGESLSLVSRQGYQRLLISSSVVRVEDALSLLSQTSPPPGSLTVIQDRVVLHPDNRSRFVEACEQAYHFGKGRLTVWTTPSKPGSTATPLPPENPRRFSNRFHCAPCDIDYTEPSTPLFSFNHPLGACPDCRGFGRIITIDYRLAMPDLSKTLAEGVVKPWLGGVSADCQRDLMRACKATGIPTHVPFHRMSKEHQDWVIQGEPDYGKDDEHQWPRAWYGVKGYFRWLESKAYKMHVRVLLARYRAYTRCPKCQGQRFRPESLHFRLDWPEGWSLPPEWTQGANATRHGSAPQSQRRTLSDFYQLSVRDALRWCEEWIRQFDRPKRDPLRLVLDEVRSRLHYLDEVGLGYLTLDRPTRTLSGGETERVNLTTCLGSRLVNTLFVLDEPSVGLHSRDTQRLVTILHRLRDTGNTVVVVEHEASVMRAADRILDLGPHQGERGGEIVFHGPFSDILNSARSLTGQYLSGRRGMDVHPKRPVIPCQPAGPDAGGWLCLRGATAQNLNDVDVDIPLGRLVCVTGVSGSGKTTLVREVLLPAMESRQRQAAVSEEAEAEAGASASATEDSSTEAPDSSAAGRLRELHGAEAVDRVVMVDQSSLGRTPRSNPVVYVGAFDAIRKLFADSPMARERGLEAGGFSFNSSRGQCHRCRGAGFEKIEMQFLSDVYVRCGDCGGRRYREHVLEVKLKRPTPKPAPSRGSSSLVLPAVHYGKGRAKLARGKSVAASRIDSSSFVLNDRMALSVEGSPLVDVADRSQEEGWSIADMLDATVEDAIAFLDVFEDNRDASAASRMLTWLMDVGLGYLRLGQPINTLSGGESQRLKLVKFLAESAESDRSKGSRVVLPAQGIPRTLFVFDEPTTGLHFDDVRVLLNVFHRLVDAGHSLLIIEHNLDVIMAADWVIDLGPEAGAEGGKVVVAGPPSAVAVCQVSHTGRALREMASEKTMSKPATGRTES